MPTRPSIAIIGCGHIGELLLERLRNSRELLLIEKNPDTLAKLQKRFPSRNIRYHCGDATSAVVLEECGIEHSYHVILTINDDQSTKEIVDILEQRFRKSNLVVRIKDRELAKEMRKRGISVDNPYETAATMMLNQVNLGETIALNIGKGEGEIVQIELTPSSPLIGRPLKELPPSPWLIGAIYRPTNRLTFDSAATFTKKFQITKGDDLIIPHGDTVPQKGDKMILIGDPQILRATAQYIKAGAPVFPVRYGEWILALIIGLERDVKGFRELKWLMQHMEPCEMSFFHTREESRTAIERINFPKKWRDAGKSNRNIYQASPWNLKKEIGSFSQKHHLGLLLYKQPLKRLRRFFHRHFIFPGLVRVARKEKFPIYLVRGGAPIAGIDLFVSSDPGSLSAAELAIDAALKFRLTITAIQVNPPSLIAGNKQLEIARQMMNSVLELGTLYGVSITELVRTGNPVSEMLKLVPKNHLLVLSIPKKTDDGLFIPNSSSLLVRKFKGSAMFIAT